MSETTAPRKDIGAEFDGWVRDGVGPGHEIFLTHPEFGDSMGGWVRAIDKARRTLTLEDRAGNTHELRYPHALEPEASDASPELGAAAAATDAPAEDGDEAVANKGRRKAVAAATKG